MEATSDILVQKVLNKYDPTHTTTLRNAYAREMKRRFDRLIRVIWESVVEKDCFGLKKDISLHQFTPASWRQFAFPRSAEKLEAFMKWLQEQVDKGILDVRYLEQIGRAVEAHWQNLYLFDSYRRGIMRARYEMRRRGRMDVPPPEKVMEFGALFGAPMHIDRLGLIFTRAYNELKGITDAMNMQISRVLAQGIADGDGMRLIARKLVATINGKGVGDLGITDTLGRFIPARRRAEMLARTEIIRAHHLATIQEYRNWGVLNIEVMAEFKTAGDMRVCEKCASLEGKRFTLDEIEGMIPVHPECRCIALPYIEELKEFY